MVFRATIEKKEEKERVRIALLRAALRLAATHGFASLGLREVAREGGIAPTSFYRHFADMEELGMALIRELVGGARREWTARALSTPRDQVVPTLVEAVFSATVGDPDLMRFLVAERVGAFAGFRALIRGELGGLANALHTAYRGEARDAASSPPFEADAAVSLLVDVCGKLLDQPATEREPLIESLARAMQRLLGAADG